MIVIKHKDTGKALHRVEASTLQGASLQNAKLQNAKLQNAKLTKALYNQATEWPAGFDPKKRGAKLVE